MSRSTSFLYIFLFLNFHRFRDTTLFVFMQWSIDLFFNCILCTIRKKLQKLFYNSALKKTKWLYKIQISYINLSFFDNSVKQHFDTKTTQTTRT